MRRRFLGAFVLAFALGACGGLFKEAVEELVSEAVKEAARDWGKKFADQFVGVRRVAEFIPSAFDQAKDGEWDNLVEEIQDDQDSDGIPERVRVNFGEGQDLDQDGKADVKGALVYEDSDDGVKCTFDGFQMRIGEEWFTISGSMSLSPPPTVNDSTLTASVSFENLAVEDGDRVEWNGSVSYEGSDTDGDGKFDDEWSLEFNEFRLTIGDTSMTYDTEEALRGGEGCKYPTRGVLKFKVEGAKVKMDFSEEGCEYAAIRVGLIKVGKLNLETGEWE